MLKRFRKRALEEKADLRRGREKRHAYRSAAKEWEKQFPPLSCHPPYVSPEEMEKLERILKERSKSVILNLILSQAQYNNENRR